MDTGPKLYKAEYISFSSLPRQDPRLMPFQICLSYAVQSGPPVEAFRNRIAPRTIGLQQTTGQGVHQRRLGTLRDRLDKITFAMSTVSGMGV
jgi:hypothetical protein